MKYYVLLVLSVGERFIFKKGAVGNNNIRTEHNIILINIMLCSVRFLLDDPKEINIWQ